MYKEFGGKAGITVLINRFVGNVAADSRINGYFAHTNIPFLKKMLVLQVCQVTGGPCVYPGPSMKAAHASLGVTTAAFNALVEDLQAAMNKQHIRLSAQNRLIGILAPLKNVIVAK